MGADIPDGAYDVVAMFEVISGESFEGTIELGPRSAPVKGTRTHGPNGGAR